jgi:type II secretory pathway component PulF
MKRDWALIVPWAIGGLGLFAAFCVLAFIYPPYIALFTYVGVHPVPLLTMVLMRVSHLATSGWWLGAIGALVACLALWLVRRTEAGRLRLSASVRRWRSLLVGLGLAAAVIGVAGVPLVWVPIYLLFVRFERQVGGR